MAGPGGGRGGGHRSGGGGFGGGGHRGGGFGGGGFGRGPRGFRFYRRPYGYGYYGGGIIGGLLSIILVPIFIIIFAAIVLIINLSVTIDIVKDGGQVIYDEETFQDYANANYYDHFSDTVTEEDGVMIIILTYEDNQELAYVAWVGDNLESSVNDIFGVDDEFGIYLERTVNIDNYKYSISKDLSKVMNHMATEVGSLDLDSPFVEQHDMSGAPRSVLINRSELDMNKNTVESALEKFTEDTGIPCAILVDKAEAVFGKSMPVGNIVMSIITVALIAFCVYSIIKSVKNHKKNRQTFKVSEAPGSSSSSFDGTREDADYDGLDRDTFE